MTTAENLSLISLCRELRDKIINDPEERIALIKDITDSSSPLREQLGQYGVDVLVRPDEDVIHYLAGEDQDTSPQDAYGMFVKGMKSGYLGGKTTILVPCNADWIDFSGSTLDDKGIGELEYSIALALLEEIGHCAQLVDCEPGMNRFISDTYRISIGRKRDKDSYPEPRMNKGAEIGEEYFSRCTREIIETDDGEYVLQRFKDKLFEYDISLFVLEHWAEEVPLTHRNIYQINSLTGMHNTLWWQSRHGENHNVDIRMRDVNYHGEYGSILIFDDASQQADLEMIYREIKEIKNP